MAVAVLSCAALCVGERGKEALMEATQHAYDQGAFGVPTFFVYNAEQGHDDGTMVSEPTPHTQRPVNAPPALSLVSSSLLSSSLSTSEWIG